MKENIEKSVEDLKKILVNLCESTKEYAKKQEIARAIVNRSAKIIIDDFFKHWNKKLINCDDEERSLMHQICITFMLNSICTIINYEHEMGNLKRSWKEEILLKLKDNFDEIENYKFGKIENEKEDEDDDE